MAIIKLSKNERRRISGFITCLVLAIIAWLLTNLSEPKQYTAKMVVNFTNPPLHRSFRSLQSDTVFAEVQGSGWNLLFSSMNMDNTNLLVDLKNLDARNYIVLSSQLKDINEKRPPGRPIIAFNPDTLYFDFSSRAVKRVPVKLLYDINFTQQFGISNSIIVRPDYVTISGPAADLDKITSWKTDSLLLKDVDATIDQNVRLQPLRESNMTMYPKSVQVQVPVDEFTEKTIEIPVKLIDNKNYYSVKIFPQKVKVTFLVSLGKYASTDDTFFEAVVDLNQWREKGYEELPVKLTRTPDFCKIVNITPQSVDFIVKK